MTKPIDHQAIIVNYITAYKAANGHKPYFAIEYINGYFYCGAKYKYRSVKLLDMTQVLNERVKDKENV